MTPVYRIAATKEDPFLSLKLPEAMLKDLVKRSEENGRSIEVEVALRLARSLERDQEMFSSDDALAQAAFEKIEAILKRRT